MSDNLVSRGRTKQQRLNPSGKKYAQSVNRAGDRPGVLQRAYNNRLSVWRQLLQGKLFAISRQNKGLYREGMALVRAELAKFELETKDTLWIRKHPHCDEDKIKLVLYANLLGDGKPVKSPTHLK